MNPTTLFATWLKRTTAVLALAVLTACGGESEVTVTTDSDAADTAQSDTPIADELKKPIDRAKAVEDMAMDRKAEMDRRLAEMEGETTDDDEP